MLFIGINFHFDLDTFTLFSDLFCTQGDNLLNFTLCHTKVDASEIYAKVYSSKRDPLIVAPQVYHWCLLHTYNIVLTKKLWKIVRG